MKNEKNIKKSKLSTAIIALSIILLLTYFFWDKAVFVIDRHLPSFGDEEKSNEYYERIASKLSNKTIAIKRGNLQIKRILEGYNYSYFNDMQISPTMWARGGNTVSIKSFSNANEDYRLIKEKNKPGNILGEYEIGISILNWFGGNSNKAIKILEDLNYLKNEKLEITRQLNLAAMYIGLSRFEEAEELVLKTLKENDSYNYFKRDLLSYIYFFRGEYDRFEEINSYKYKTLEYKDNKITGVKHNDDEKDIPSWNEIESLSPYLKILEELKYIIGDMKLDKEYYENKEKTNNSMTGYVKYNDKPLRGMVVYLKKSKDNGMSTGGFLSEEIYGITDENGRYEIKNIPNQDYNIGLYGSWNQIQGKQLKLIRKNISFDGNTSKRENIELYDCIKLKELKYIDDNKIKITWENPAGDGFEYGIIFGEIRDNNSGLEIADFSYINSIKTMENSIEIDLNKLKKISIGNVYSWGEGFVEPYQVIEPLYHKGQYAVEINAYPINEDYKFIGSDNYGVYGNKLYDSLFVEGNQWNKGDKLLLQKKYPEAIRWFENKLKEDPEDIHSMKILSTVCSHGYRGKGGGGGLTGQDIKKGIKYTEMLMGKIGETEHILNTLADLYKRDGQYEKAIEYYLKSVQNTDVAYEYRQIGDIYMKMNKWHEALKYYSLYFDNSSYENYSDILLLSILMDDKENVLKYSKLLENEDYYIDYKKSFEKYINMSRDEYIELYKLINQEKIEEARSLIKDDESDFGDFYRGLLLLAKKHAYYEGKEKEEEMYYNFYQAQGNKTLKLLMKYFGQKEIVSSFGDVHYAPRNKDK
ncbi:tetratricopeptide repeat protein [Maledivibacter halophilus]|uniref:TPR repeat-containing protein n=1 Tax=Maledivibacter halophilus TaxID=36842 RepID=A0A1T5MC29_9FIRM|nr:tetratricopeptide repeat protein [Maledivibacter halophilus]SKC85786.1 TPR repeat-containing protein [Maledivibacter halophilus]